MAGLNPVPQPGQTLGSTRNLVFQNFINFIDTQFKVDHQQFNSGDGSGMHNKVTYLQQPSSLNFSTILPPIPINANVIYNAIPDKTANGNFPVTLTTSELNIFKNGSSAIIPFTAANRSTNGWTYLPSGLLLKWGTVTIPSRNTRTAAIPMPNASTDPLYTAVYMMSAIQTFSSSESDGNLNVAISVGEITIANPTTFKLFARAVGTPFAGPTLTVMWFAVGI